MCTVRTVKLMKAPRDFLYPWLPKFTFSIDELSTTQQEQLGRISAVEAVFAQSRDRFNRFVRFLLLGTDSLDYVIALEYKSRVRSHVRSYKGVFKDRSGVSSADRASFDLHNDLDRVSCEIGVGGDYTHLVGLVRPNPRNAEDCLERLGDSTRSFVLVNVLYRSGGTGTWAFAARAGPPRPSVPELRPSRKLALPTRVSDSAYGRSEQR